jgi:glycosyltransferase involved in cell wall biosynthesis
LHILELAHEHEWYLYADRPLKVVFPNNSNIHIRTGNLSQDRISTLYSQIFFPLWANKDNVDIFWSPRHHLPILLSRKIKKFVTIHDIVWKRYPETMTRLGRLLDRLLMPISLNISDHILSVSEFTKNELINALDIAPSKITVTPLAPTKLPVDTTSELPNNLIGKNFFLFVGTIEPRKNLKNLLSAFAQFCNTNNKYYLVIAGKDGWGNESITEIVNNLKLKNRVIILGYVKENVLHSLYQNCSALLMPSLYEGYGLPAIEALNYAKPVITTAHSAISSKISPLVITIKDEGIDSIIESINKIKSVAKYNYERPALTTWKDSAQTTLDTLLHSF